ncbi:BREX-1 system adenine-specific DNA-methyltransferase PglX [Neobacillus terrae]|uniref:BREX-1 system adenine-specific DNA-methyltransferase PglX n=1 Tax=Neobacillus terrae TaxID=3034837 RepID=UPI00140D9E75|nr:BREX-1 system adenine-specific DNA-methyltransferase PglX [Neobacillus terrae]NHM30667.1 BREX-1 system adenine-specific DNA-methyltransferase PglX [Neobacillus terrae]
MNKSALKTFATSARNELLKKVEAKAMKIGITEDNIKKADIESSDAIFIDGKQLSKEEKMQRDKLIARINQIGFKQVMEEVAYTWFNRFTALRFMEVNDFLPTGVRVLSSSNPNSADPDMLNEAFDLDLEIELDKEYIYNLKLNNETEELFKYLIIKHCNEMNRYLPFMFEKIDDYTEILFPEGLLAKESFIRQMTDTEFISNADWEEVEIIGWLYQYYNTELNALVYDGNMARSKIPKELLPAATQLFTPDWAVKYMVENSLGRLWLEGHSNQTLQDGWKYYLENENNNDSNGIKLTINPEEIKVFDPCMGSGHILVYAFDVLMDIYKSCGYIPRDAAKLILQKNLYGLEIEDRAYQLACFSVVMKARKYNRRILDEKVDLNLCSIIESNEISSKDIKDTINLEDKDIETANYLISIFKNAKEYGSIINVENKDYSSFLRFLTETTNQEVRDLFQVQFLAEINEIMPKLIKQAQIMTQKYEIVITNPPYLGSSRMSPLLNNYVKENYPITKADLSMVMYQKVIDSFSKLGGYISFITTNSWMFLSSFEQLRKMVLNKLKICSLVDFGTELFDGKVGHNQIVSWVNKNDKPNSNDKKLIAIRLIEFNYSKRNQKESEFFNKNNKYYVSQKTFFNIPGYPIAYWVSKNLRDSFIKFPGLSEHFIPKFGMSVGDGQKFIRNWYEVSINDIQFNATSTEEYMENNPKWNVLDKGGAFRRWYGNRNHIVLWENNGEEIKANPKAAVRSPQYFFKPHLSWTLVTSNKFSVRYFEKGFILDTASNCIYFNGNQIDFYVLGLMNSNLCQEILDIINPTLNYSCGVIGVIPYNVCNEKKEEVISIVKENIEISKIDWDSTEISWDFKKSPLLQVKGYPKLIKETYNKRRKFTEEQFNKLWKNEEELNSIFLEIYNLQGEISPKVKKEEITISIADKGKDIKNFISYFIGCLFGRYSLDEEGLIFAGGLFNPDRYNIFNPDKDNIIPILTGAYFEDDIVSRFIEFVNVTFGEENLIENLDYIANTLGKKKGETAKETIRRYFLNDFYKDHVQTYKKRPIYWLFTSGKEKAFNCIIYMHRYDKTTLSRIRTDYLHEYQIRLDAEKKDLLSIIEGDYTPKEISSAKKELKLLDKKIEELKEYDELVHHMADMQIEIDLNYGVEVNYESFKGLVAKI